MFVRFAWGRTRLPRRLEDFKDAKFTLQLMNKYKAILHCHLPISLFLSHKSLP
jgi:hypothetical protein